MVRTVDKFWYQSSLVITTGSTPRSLKINFLFIRFQLRESLLEMGAGSSGIDLVLRSRISLD